MPDEGRCAAVRRPPSRLPWAWIGGFGLLLTGASPALAVPYAGGGPARTDCFVTLDAPVNTPATAPRRVLCTDGDPSCDADATIDGVCRIPVTVCANTTGGDRCTPGDLASIAVDHAIDNGDPRFDVDFQALQTRIDGEIQPPTAVTDLCTTVPVLISVPVRGPTARERCSPGRKTLRLTGTTPLPEGRRDRDRLPLRCLPASCDPQVLFTGTFDRLQTQIFDASCATSGCHDSQGLRGGLTLERGTAHTAIVGVVPENAAAAGSGWLRVTPGDPATSFVYRKVSGLPDASFGARMPFGRRRLPGYLIDLLEAWIAAGAPETGWVPGTD